MERLRVTPFRRLEDGYLVLPVKILMIAPQPFFKRRGTPLSILGRLTALSTLGHQVDLLTYHLGETIHKPNVVISRIRRVPFIREVPIGPSIRKLFLDLLVCIKAFGMLTRNRYDMIHSHEEGSFFGVALARHFGIPHLYDMHSSLPEQLSNCDYSRFPPIIRVFEWLERRVINGSQVIIAICPSLVERVTRINPRIPCLLIENIPLEGDPGTVLDAEISRFRVAHSLSGRRIILYAGTFERYQGLDILIEGAAHVLRAHRDAFFLLMGGTDAQMRHYQRRVDDLGLGTHFRFTGLRPATEMPVALRCADILVSPRIQGTNTPSKIFEYLRAGRPIVATNIEAHTQIVTSEVAVLVEPRAAALANGILFLLENPGSALNLAARARSLYDRHYSLQTFIDKTEQALRLATLENTVVVAPSTIPASPKTDGSQAAPDSDIH